MYAQKMSRKRKREDLTALVDGGMNAATPVSVASLEADALPSPPADDEHRQHPVYKHLWCSASGRCYSTMTRRYVGYLESSGRYIVKCAREDDVAKNEQLARLVHESWHGVVLNSSIAVDHINGDRKDNRPCNLQALSHGDHAIKTRKQANAATATMNYTRSVGRSVTGTAPDGTNHGWNSVSEAARESGVARVNVQKAIDRSKPISKGPYAGWKFAINDTDATKESQRPLSGEEWRRGVAYAHKRDGSSVPLTWEASNLGRVRDTRGRITRGTLTQRGYMEVSRYEDAKSFTMLVHRIIADIFLAPTEFTTEVNHKDKNKQNNHASNLEWTDRIGNMTHASGRAVEGLDANGDVIFAADSINSAARALHCTSSNIRSAIKAHRAYAGMTWRHAGAGPDVGTTIEM